MSIWLAWKLINCIQEALHHCDEDAVPSPDDVEDESQEQSGGEQVPKLVEGTSFDTTQKGLIFVKS